MQNLHTKPQIRMAYFLKYIPWRQYKNGHSHSNIAQNWEVT